MTVAEILQQAKVENRFVRLTMRSTSPVERARVIDVDRSEIYVLVGERERRRLHLPDILEATLIA